jgi:NADH:ubiquinone oxidoreductase subunit 3 (subunit A)
MGNQFQELGMEGMVKMVVFYAFFLVGFLHHQKKALEWE